MVNSNIALSFQMPETSEREIRIEKSPISWASISLSNVIARGTRLDASVYDTVAKQVRDIITHGKYPYTQLYGSSCPIKEAYYGSRMKRNYVSALKSNIIGFLGSSEMLDVYPHPVKFMEDTDRVKGLHVLKGMVLLSRSGTIGNLTFVGNTLSKFLISEHAIRLVCDKYSGYVYTFLKTKSGQVLLHSSIYGAVIQEIEPEHLKTIPIPDAPGRLKDEINDLIVRSYKLRDESNDLLDEANALLIKELRLPSIHELREKANYYEKDAPVDTFSVRLRNMAVRLDASFHVPIVDAIVMHLAKHAAEVTTVGDPRISKEVILPGRFKRVYVDEGHGPVFIGGKQLWELDPSNKKYLSIVHHAERIKKQLELHENMTLITCSGTIGKVALVGKHWENWTANQHIIRIIPASLSIAGYINIFLSSDYGHQLITRYTYGSVVDEIDDNHVRQIPIPLLNNKEVQSKINSLALEANKKRYEAYQLEQKALQKMNNEVIFAK